MIFKGTLGTGGTISSLPTASASNAGWMYKVITAGTYAGQSAKVGDSFVCAKTGTSSYQWVYIPSGDEPEGTVTSVTISTNAPLSVDSSSPITTAGTRTITHNTASVTAGTYGSSSGNTTKVPKITVDAFGHVQGIVEDDVADRVLTLTPTVSLGGISKGVTKTYSYSDWLENLLCPYVAPVSYSIKTNLIANWYEKGVNQTVSTVTPTFTAGSRAINSATVGSASGGSDLYNGSSATSGTAFTLTTQSTFSTTTTIFSSISDGTTTLTA